ncbi:MAG: NUDIX domain-containing protein [Anaerolineae bacterium]|jgi:8-oxo-dGTP diphosphatase
MPISSYIAELRAKIGQALLLLPAAAAIIQDEEGRVLLIRRGDGRGWSLPGGMMEPGERIAEAVVREVWEETGLEVEPVRLVGVYSDPAHTHITFPNGDEVHFVSSTFACRVVGGRLRPDGDESLEVAYFAPEALPVGVIGDHERRIRDALAGREAAFFR